MLALQLMNMLIRSSSKQLIDSAHLRTIVERALAHERAPGQTPKPVLLRTLVTANATTTIAATNTPRAFFGTLLTAGCKRHCRPTLLRGKTLLNHSFKTLGDQP